MLQPAKTDWVHRGNSGVVSSFNRPSSCVSLPLSFLWQENSIQWCLDKPQAPLRNSPIGNRLELLLHIRSTSSWSALWFYCSTSSKLLGTAHTWMNEPKWNLKLEPLSKPLNPPPPFQTLPWPPSHPLIPPHNFHNTRPRTQWLEPPLTPWNASCVIPNPWTPTNKLTNNTMIQCQFLLYPSGILETELLLLRRSANSITKPWFSIITVHKAI